MASSVLAMESIKLDEGLAGQTVRCARDKEPPHIYGERWSSRRGKGCGWRLASALAGTSDACSGKLGLTEDKTLGIPEAEPTGGDAVLAAIEAVVGNAIEDCADTGNGKINIKRTGEFIFSASSASRGATATNTYPGASADPTVNGCAGFPSTAINAAPWPALLEITPDKTNLSAGLGPGPACGNDLAPRSLANASLLAMSGGFITGAALAVLDTRAEIPTCIQNHPDNTTDAHTRVVALRHANVLFKLNIEIQSSHGDIFGRKSFHGKPSCCPTRRREPIKNRRGFTLIELMVVLVIIGVLAALIVPNVLDRADDARVMAARTDVNNLSQALKLYKLDNQRLPTTEQGLQALIVKPTAAPVPASWKAYLDKLPNDPWGRPYQYLNPGVKGEVDVMSLGADGQPGGEGRNADVGSWQ